MLDFYSAQTYALSYLKINVLTVIVANVGLSIPTIRDHRVVCTVLSLDTSGLSYSGNRKPFQQLLLEHKQGYYKVCIKATLKPGWLFLWQDFTVTSNLESYQQQIHPNHFGSTKFDSVRFRRVFEQALTSSRYYWPGLKIPELQYERRIITIVQRHASGCMHTLVKEKRIMTDSTRIQAESQVDVLDLVFQPEIKEFLVTTIQMVPKLTNMMKMTSKLCDLAERVMEDTEMLGSLEEAIREKTEPIQEKIEDGISLVEEARERAEEDTSNVGMIGLYRMLKDPTVQKNLRFMKALLATIAERQMDDHKQ
jgi:uncharacterized protein YjgD (DUF1641 family)